MACTRGALEQIPRHQERNTRHQFTNMLDKLPVELLKLVGDAICPSSQIKNDVVIHGAVLDASGHLVLNWDPQRANLEARQALAHARVVCRFLRKELPPPRLKLRTSSGPVPAKATSRRVALIHGFPRTSCSLRLLATRWSSDTRCA